MSHWRTEHILPLRFDDTSVLGLLHSIVDVEAATYPRVELEYSYYKSLAESKLISCKISK
jgi:hypothetical protein